MIARLLPVLFLATAALSFDTKLVSRQTPVDYYPAVISTEWSQKNVIQPAIPVKAGSALVLGTLVNSPEQTWLLKDGATKLQLNGTDLCIDAGTGRSNGSPITVAKCVDNLAAQNWNFNKDRQITLDGTKLCADLYAGSLNNGTKIVLWNCIAGDKNHIWKVANLTAKP